jgi:hypothetical protein
MQVDWGTKLTLVNIDLEEARGDIPIDGKVVDVSPTGMCIAVNRPFRIGTRFRVDITIKGQKLAFYAIVRRLLPSNESAPTIFRHGVQVIGASEAAIQGLAAAVLGLQMQPPLAIAALGSTADQHAS